MLRNYTREEYNALTDEQRRHILANTPKDVQLAHFQAEADEIFGWWPIIKFILKWGLILIAGFVFTMMFISEWPGYFLWVVQHVPGSGEWLDAHLPAAWTQWIVQHIQAYQAR